MIEKALAICVPYEQYCGGSTASPAAAGSIKCSHSGCLTSLFPQERVNSFTVPDEVTFICPMRFLCGSGFVVQIGRVSLATKGNENGFSVAG